MPSYLKHIQMNWYKRNCNGRLRVFHDRARGVYIEGENGARREEKVTDRIGDMREREKRGGAKGEEKGGIGEWERFWRRFHETLWY